MNKRDNIAFIRRIQPGETITLKESVKAPGTVENLTARFYPGQQRSLQVNPVIMHNGEASEPIMTYSKSGGGVSDTFLAGDDDRIEFVTSIPVNQYDQIWVTATNTDTVNAYDLVVYVMVDYLGGEKRA